MSYKLTDGDYEYDENGRLKTVEYIEELLQNALLALSTTRGKFYPDKNFGSSIGSRMKQPREEYAAAFARAALEGFDGIFVKSAVISDGVLTVGLIINDNEEEVNISLENNV